MSLLAGLSQQSDTVSAHNDDPSAHERMRGHGDATAFKIPPTATARSNTQIRIELPMTFPFAACEDGANLLVQDEDGTPLPHWLHSFSATEFRGVLYTLVPFIGAGESRFLRVSPTRYAVASRKDDIFRKFTATADTLALFNFDSVVSGNTVLDATGNYTATIHGLAGDWTQANIHGGTIGDSSESLAGKHIALNPSAGTTRYGSISIPGFGGEHDGSGTIEFWFRWHKKPEDETSTDTIVIFSMQNNAADVGGGTHPANANWTEGINLTISPDDGKFHTTVLHEGVYAEVISTCAENKWTLCAITWAGGCCEVSLNGVRVFVGDHLNYPALWSQLANNRAYFGAYAWNITGLQQLFWSTVDFGPIRWVDRVLCPAEIEADYWRSTFVAGAVEQSRWVEDGVIMEANAAQSAGGEHWVQEHTVMFDGGIWKSWYNSSEAVWYSTSKNGTDWTVVGKVLGQGVGGETFSASHPFVAKFGDIYYCYYASSSADFHVATSPDGVVWTKNPQVICARPVWSNGAMANFCVIYDDGMYIAAFDCQATVNGKYRVAFAKATTPAPVSATPNFVEIAGGPPKSLCVQNVDVVDEGHTAAAFLMRIDAAYHLWYNSAPWGNAGSEINHYINHSRDLVTWEPLGPQPVRPFKDRSDEVDQIGEPHIVEHEGVSYLFCNAINNNTRVSKLKRLSFDGTLRELCTDSGSATS